VVLKTVTAVIIDGQFISRRGIVTFLREKLKFSSVQEFADVQDAIDWMNSNGHPDLVVVDSALVFSSSVGGLNKFCSASPGVPIAVLDARRDWETAFSVFEAGAKGFLPRGLNESQFQTAVDQLLSGNVYVPSDMMQGQRNPNQTRSRASDQYQGCLTERQIEVLTILSKGKSNKEIGRALQISESTVKVHIAAAFRLLGVHNRVGAIAKLQSGRYSHLLGKPADFSAKQMSSQAF
jgi:DNA-binding NarL/FixJ family response regulator